MLGSRSFFELEHDLTYVMELQESHSTIQSVGAQVQFVGIRAQGPSGETSPAVLWSI
jgi:hypothetical protein